MKGMISISAALLSLGLATAALAEESPGPIPVERVGGYTPAAAYAAGIEGTAKVLATVNEAGSVDKVEIMSEAPEGFGFGIEAAAAVKQWKFQERRPGTFEVVMNFKNEPEQIPVLQPPAGAKLDYPRRAARNGQVGEVVLAIDLNANGRVVGVTLMKEEPVNWGFAAAASEAVKDWNFGDVKPGLYTITIKFRME